MDTINNTLYLPSHKGQIQVVYEMMDTPEGPKCEILSITPEDVLPYTGLTGLEVYQGQYRLYWISQAKEKSQPIEVHNYFDDEVSNLIAKTLGEKQEEQSPRFGK